MSLGEQLPLLFCEESLPSNQRAGGDCAPGQTTIPEHSNERGWDAGSICLHPHLLQRVSQSPAMCRPGGAASDK